ncbi:type II toxin-antitoxin system YoeB family toxin [Candidatus Pacearchaeota archaeon]|nr:type II toxin-antitoxin system YoeB family toxin [Candidatus Pacearchaeota archaeon]
MKLIKKSRVVFADENLQKEFEELSENDKIKKQIKRAVGDLQINAFSGIQIPKKLIPEVYIKKYQVNNLWKYDLPDGWRLVYSIMPENKIEILSVILEWFDHKEYEQRFHY